LILSQFKVATHHERRHHTISPKRSSKRGRWQPRRPERLLDRSVARPGRRPLDTSDLVEHDIVHKVQYQERPARFEYRLTPKGMDLSPALVALMGWGDRWAAGGQPPTLLVHDACATPLEQVLLCPACDETVRPSHIRSRPGPGRQEQA